MDNFLNCEVPWLINEDFQRRLVLVLSATEGQESCHQFSADKFKWDLANFWFFAHSKFKPQAESTEKLFIQMIAVFIAEYPSEEERSAQTRKSAWFAVSSVE